MPTLIILLVAFVTPLVIWRWIVRLPPGGIEDDGYFYASIAYHAGVHGLFSFDGIHVTDGFHMLWGYLLAGGSRLLSTVTQSRSAHLYLACVISFAVIALIADRFGRRHRDKILLFGLGTMGTLLMETPLLTLLVLTLIMANPPSAASVGSHRVWYVLLPMAITSTRIDATIISVVWAACLLFERRRRLAASVALGILLGGIFQVALNWHTAGEWFSVAAELKMEASLAAVGRGMPGRILYPGRALLLWMLLATSLLAVWRQARATGDRQWLFAWLAIASFTLPHLVRGMRPWYMVPGYLGMTALLVAARDTGAPSAARVARVGIAAAWLGLAGYVVIEAGAGMRYAEETRAIEDFVRDVRRIVPAGEPIYQVDGSGYIGFFSGRPVVNGDGLVNTHQYAERMKDGRLAGYLDEEQIDFIISNHADPSSPVVNWGGVIVPRDAVDEVARKRGPAVNRYTNFRLFRRKAIAQTLPAATPR